MPSLGPSKMADPAPASAAAPEVPPAQRKLAPAERELVAADVRLAFHYQRARWEAVRTGAALGAEEVQDQRLSAAEAPPEANPGFELFVVLFTVLLEGPVAGWIARGLQTQLASALRAEIKLQGQAYRALLETEGANVAPALHEAQRIAAARAASTASERSMFTAMVAERSTSNRESWLRHTIKEADIADRELALTTQRLNAAVKASADFGRLRATRALLKGVRGDSVPEWIIGAQKGVFQRVQQVAATPDRAAPGASGVSAGVVLRAAIEKQALERIQELWFQQECLEVVVRGEAMTAGKATDLYEAFAMAVPVDNALVIDHYQLLTAALIWARLLGVAGLRMGRRRDQDARSRTSTGFSGDRLAPGSRQASALATAPEKHVDYLVARFGAAAEAWARGAPQDVALPDQMLKGPTDPAALEGFLRAGKADASAAPGFLERTLFPRATTKDFRLDLVLQFFDATAEHTPDLGISPANR